MHRWTEHECLLKGDKVPAKTVPDGLILHYGFGIMAGNARVLRSNSRAGSRVSP